VIATWKVLFWLKVAGLGQWLIWRAAKAIKVTVYGSEKVQITFLPVTQWTAPKQQARAD
jgi:hypothetical protein